MEANPSSPIQPLPPNECIGNSPSETGLRRLPFHEPRGSGAGVPPADGASRPRIRCGRDAREDSRDGCPTTAPSLFMVPMRANYGVGRHYLIRPDQIMSPPEGAGPRKRAGSSRSDFAERNRKKTLSPSVIIGIVNQPGPDGQENGKSDPDTPEPAQSP